MIAWQNPAALAGLAALAVPVILHLLRRRQAVRIAFPNIRFIDPSLTGAVRLRLPADVLLLAIRMGILGLAVCAVGQPIVLTPGRVAAWNARTLRAVVVDVSASMRPHTAAAGAAADTETRAAFEALRIDAADLAHGLRRASGSLLKTSPGMREIVVISDFAAGSLDAATLDAIPAAVGLRFVPIGSPNTRSRFAGPALLGPGGGTAYPSITLDGERTRVLMAPGAERIRGLALHTAAPTDAASLLDVVAASGAPAPDATQPIEMFFAGGGSAAKPSRIVAGWMLDTVLRLRDDEELARAAHKGGPGMDVREATPPWVALARNNDGTVLVRAAALDRTLAIDVAAPADSFVAAAALRAALWARAGDVARHFAEREVLRIPNERLAGWSRQPRPVSRDAWPQSTDNDARWFWAGVLALLGVESVLRRRKPADAPQELRAACERSGAAGAAAAEQSELGGVQGSPPS